VLQAATRRVRVCSKRLSERPARDEAERSDELLLQDGLKSFEDIEDISIVAAPGSTFGYQNGYRADAARSSTCSSVARHAHALPHRRARQRRRPVHRRVRAMRAQDRLDLRRASTTRGCACSIRSRAEINLPPSGLRRGIYARNDVERAVYKAPANEVVNLAIGFETLLNKAQQDVLNPEGINCFRFFEGRGFRLWGARTASSDPEWKYVNLRRYFAYLERSIDKGTQWAVFEPNGEQLWANVRRTIEDFLSTSGSRGAARRQAGEGVLRALRPQHDDAERPRQRPARLPDRRRAAQARPSSSSSASASGRRTARSKSRQFSG
jgi:hypothetical protein